jgi:hypothetical protein
MCFIDLCANIYKFVLSSCLKVLFSFSKGGPQNLESQEASGQEDEAK